MKQTFEATEVDIGFHPSGYRIDKTASAINRYTQWSITPEKEWCDPRPVCFDSLPQEGWFKVDRLNWDEIGVAGEAI